MKDKKRASINKLMLIEKMEEICTECNDDLKDIRLYLKYKYDLGQSDLSRVMRAFKKIIEERSEKAMNSNYVKEFLVKIRRAYYVY